LIAEIAQKPLSDWLDIFREVEACVEGVQTFAEVVEDPQFQQRDMILRLQDQDGREWQQFGSPFKLSKTPNQYGLPGGALGADNQQVIESELELTSGTYDQLKAEGVFG
jgi:crotonobetainyl-CoA:carnitine CoA-transferase CaiB-like acyl-CoA transferase